MQRLLDTVHSQSVSYAFVWLQTTPKFYMSISQMLPLLWFELY